MLGWLAILRLLCSDLNVLHPSRAADVTRARRQQVLSLSAQVYEQVEQPCVVAAAPEHHPPPGGRLSRGFTQQSRWKVQLEAWRHRHFVGVACLMCKPEC